MTPIRFPKCNPTTMDGTDPSTTTFAERLIAFAAVEGIVFAAR